MGARPPTTIARGGKKNHYVYTQTTCFRPLSFVSRLPLLLLAGLYAAAAAVPLFLFYFWVLPGGLPVKLSHRTSLDALQSTSSRGASSNTPGPPPTDADDASTYYHLYSVLYI